MSKIFRSGNVNLEKDKAVTINSALNIEPAEAAADEAGEEISDSKIQSGLEKQKKNILREAENEAVKIIANARKKAETMLLDAQNECERLKEETLAESRSSGFEEGLADGKSEAERLRAEAQETLDDARETREATLNSLEPQMVELIADISRKLLGDLAAIKPEIIIHLIRAGLEGSSAPGEITVKVSEEDYQAAVDGRDEILKIMEGGTRLEIIKDLSLNKSDCVIETTYGYIDSSLGQQMEALKEDLFLITKRGSVQ